MKRDLSTGGYRSPHRVFGFSLVELSVTLGLITLVSTVGVGSFNRYIDESRADTAILSLNTALMLARSEAITRSGSVVLCRRTAGSNQCAGTSASGKADWSPGWLLFLDLDQNKLLDEGAGDVLVRVFSPVAKGFVLKWNRGDYVAYQSSGRLHSLNGTFCLGNSPGDHALRELKIPYTGRVRRTSGECSFTLFP